MKKPFVIIIFTVILAAIIGNFIIYNSLKIYSQNEKNTVRQIIQSPYNKNEYFLTYNQSKLELWNPQTGHKTSIKIPKPKQKDNYVRVYTNQNNVIFILNNQSFHLNSDNSYQKIRQLGKSENLIGLTFDNQLLIYNKKEKEQEVYQSDSLNKNKTVLLKLNYQKGDITEFNNLANNNYLFTTTSRIGLIKNNKINWAHEFSSDQASQNLQVFNNTIYLSQGSEGVLISHNNGQNWKTINGGLNGAFPYYIIQSTTGDIYGLVRSGKQVFKLNKSQTKWESVKITQPFSQVPGF